MRHLDDVTSADTGRRPIETNASVSLPTQSQRRRAPMGALHGRESFAPPASSICQSRQSRPANTRTVPGRPLARNIMSPRSVLMIV